VVASPRNFLAELRLYWVCTLPLLCKPTPFVQRLALKWLGWLPKQCHTKSALGFTLAEVLISLLILAEIATFTIPKVLYSSQNQQWNAEAKEAAAAVSAAYQQYQMTNTVTSSFNIGNLTPYLNYVQVDSVSLTDNMQTFNTIDCSNPGSPCLKLHNGATLSYGTGDIFSGTNMTNATVFYIDPDGKVTDGTTNGPGKAIQFTLYYNGRLTTRAGLTPGTVVNSNPYNPNAALDPPWFHW
jgi:type II secretory pathway pseudopilin PulG